MLFSTWLRTLKARFQLPPGQRTRLPRRKQRKCVALCVEALEDRMVLSTFTVTTTADNPIAGSLRWAINQVNADQTDSSANPDTIAFNITAASDAAGGGTGYNATTGVATIKPQTALPQITNSVIIEGYTQGEGTSLAATPNTLKGVGQLGVAPGDSSQYGDNAVLKVVLDGSVAQQQHPPSDHYNTVGLEISGANSSVQGLVINNFTSNIIVDAGATGTTVSGNFVGTDVSGTTTPPTSSGDWTTQAWGITDEADNSQIGGTAAADRNLVSGFWGYGIGVGSSGTVSVQGNFIGTDHTGSQPLGSYVGVGVGSGNVLIAGNLISGNEYGIRDDGSSDQAVIQVQDNFFGTDVTGSTQLTGVGPLYGIHAGGYGNYEGSGPETFAITGNLFSGLSIAVESYATVHFQSNYVGADVTGATTVGDGYGVLLYGNNNIIGGADMQGNLFGYARAPGGFGVGLGEDIGAGPNVQNSGSLIQGNRFLPGENFNFAINLGPMTSGDTVVGNDIAGAFIGVLVQGTQNTITGNSIHDQQYDNSGDNPRSATGLGIFVTGDQNTITDNSIYNNNNDGVLVSGLVYGGGASNNTIEGNTIASNGSNGVDVESGTGNSILGNSIHDNGGLGIYLNSANNANDNQASPALTAATSSATSTMVSGTLQGVANTTYRIEFFSNQSPDPSGYGEGQTFLGSAEVTADANGYLLSSPDGSAVITNPGTANASFTATVSALPNGQDYLSATATNETTGDTSEFAHDGAVAAVGLSSSAINSVYGQSVAFTATISAAASGLGTPTGSVHFFDTTTNTDLGSVARSGGVATVSASALGAGTHVIQATYSGDGTFFGGNSLLTQVVNKATPIFSLVAPPTIIDGTSNTQITGAIAAGSLIPSGSVTVTVNGVSKTTAINPADGTFAVTVPTASLGTGSYTIGYSYAGDNNFMSASASAKMDVTNGVLALFNQSQAKNAGSTIPIQIELVTASGQDVSSANTTVTALGIAATTDTTDKVGSIDPSHVGALQPVQAVGNSNPNNVFNEQGSSKPYYTYNLQTPKGLTAGTYRLYIQVQGDPLLHWVTFSVS